jgi:RNA polymerase sigma-32 factor
MTAIKASTSSDNGRLREYIQRVNAVQTLSREEELELFERYRRAGDPRAKATLLGSHLRYVVAIAIKYRRYRVPLDELVAEGNLGIAYALSKFDPARGTRFVTYASYWVRAQILNHVIRSFSLVGVGSGAFRSKVFFKIRRERARLGNLIADEEKALARLAERVGLPESKVVDMVRRLESRDISLDATFSSESTVTLLDTLVAPGADQEHELSTLEDEAAIKRVVDEALSLLDERERFIVEHRLMAHGDDELSLAEIGRRMGVSRERARQLESRAKRKLKLHIQRAAPSFEDREARRSPAGEELSSNANLPLEGGLAA